MLTREEVIKEIETITTGGTNKADKVRDVLTTLLDYTENEDMPTVPSIPFFKFKANDVPDKSNRGSRLSYSFRGIEGRTVNFTLKFHIDKADSPDEFSFGLDPDLYLILVGIIQMKDLTFFVPIADPNGLLSGAIMRVSLETTDQIKLFVFTNHGTGISGTIFTSIHLHAPENFEPDDKSNGDFLDTTSEKLDLEKKIVLTEKASGTTKRTRSRSKKK